MLTLKRSFDTIKIS